MKKLIFILSLLFSINGIFAQTEPNTFCNPLNLDYRFVTTEPSHRTAADPVITLYKNDYYLFSSPKKSVEFCLMRSTISPG